VSWFKDWNVIADKFTVVVKEWGQEAPVRLEAYYSVEMGETAEGNFSGKRAKLPINTTNKLRVVSGDLLRSLKPREDGNITKVTYKNGQVIVETGTKVVYANIHEYGGVAGRGVRIKPRPYITPALQKFNQIEVKRLYTDIKRAFI
jgi:phage gpG-like protein